jgi:hypothetical protein
MLRTNVVASDVIGGLSRFTKNLNDGLLWNP